ncbi:GRIP and coiled-coil domain-containing protein 2 [Bulinus truncatus]|nr:GRIP and coiled-coil domain-containing protein 2 [Bulinus truncatus]
MADDKTDPPSGAVTPKGKLESLSKEDLVKFVKRQTILLQKAKVKNTELENKITELEKSPNEWQVHKENIKLLEDEVKELRQEKQEAVLAYNAVQSSQESSAEIVKNWEEQCQKLQKEKDALHDQLVQCEKTNKNLLEEKRMLKDEE